MILFLHGVVGNMIIKECSVSLIHFPPRQLASNRQIAHHGEWRVLFEDSSVNAGRSVWCVSKKLMGNNSLFHNSLNVYIGELSFCVGLGRQFLHRWGFGSVF